MTTDKEQAYKDLTIPLLKEELKKRGLTVGGNKPELIARLLQHDASTAKPKTSKAKTSKEEAPSKAKAKTSKEEAPSKAKAKTSKEEAPSKAKAKTSKEEAPSKAKAKTPKTKPSKSEGAVPKSKQKKAEAARSHESEEEVPKARPKPGTKKTAEKPAEVEASQVEKPPKAHSKTKEKAKSKGAPKPQIEVQVVEKVIEKIIEHPKPFSDSIPPEYKGKTFRVTSEQLYEALSSCSLTGALFVALSTFEEVPIRPSWNEDVKAPVDSEGYVYDEKIQMVIGRLVDGKIRSLTQSEALNLENKRILVSRHLGELKPVESSSESQGTEESVESEQDSEIDEGKSEGEEVEGRFDSTVGKFTEAVSKSFKGGVEDVEIKKVPVVTLNERDQRIANIIKGKNLSTTILLRLVKQKVQDVAESDIERVKALLAKSK